MSPPQQHQSQSNSLHAFKENRVRCPAILSIREEEDGSILLYIYKTCEKNLQMKKPLLVIAASFFLCACVNSEYRRDFWALVNEVEANPDSVASIMDRKACSRVVQHYAEHGSSSEKIRALYVRGKTAEAQGNPIKALQAYSEALHLKAGSQSDYKYMGMLNVAAANIYSMLAERSGDVDNIDMAAAYFAAASRTDLADKSGKQDSPSHLAPSLALDSYYSLLYDLSRAKTQRLWFLLAALILTTILAGGLIYLRYRRTRERNQKEKEHLEDLVEAADSRVKDLDEGLAQLRKEYSNLYRPQFELLAELMESFHKSEGDGAQLEKKFRTIMNATGKDTEGQKNFESLIDKRMQNAMSRFREEFPELAEDDFRFFSFLVVGFDATTISIIMDMPSKGSVYTRKSRIKKLISESRALGKEYFLKILA